jgi:hypothetical protein
LEPEIIRAVARNAVLNQTALVSERSANRAENARPSEQNSCDKNKRKVTCKFFHKAVSPVLCKTGHCLIEAKGAGKIIKGPLAAD